jgi:hypothetical protein
VGTVEWLNNAGIVNGKFFTFPYFLIFLLKRFLRDERHNNILKAS